MRSAWSAEAGCAPPRNSRHIPYSADRLPQRAGSATARSGCTGASPGRWARRRPEVRAVRGGIRPAGPSRPRCPAAPVSEVRGISLRSGRFPARSLQVMQSAQRGRAAASAARRRRSGSARRSWRNARSASSISRAPSAGALGGRSRPLRRKTCGPELDAVKLRAQGAPGPSSTFMLHAGLVLEACLSMSGWRAGMHQGVPN